MMKRITSMLLALSLLLVLMPEHLVNAAITEGYFAGPRTYDLTDEFCTMQENATVNGNNISLSAGGQVTFEFYIPFDSQSITFNFIGKSAPVTVFDGNHTFVVDPCDNESYTHKLDIIERKGENTYIFSSKTTVEISKITFNKKTIRTSFEDGTFELPTLTDEEYAIATAVLLHVNSSIIMVNGSRRYININNPTEVPLNINDTIYLPVHTFARAFSCYFEDLQDKEYVLIRRMNLELMFTKEECYIQKDTMSKKIIDNIVIYKNGTIYVPIRYLAEILGERVGYKDGLIAIDDNKFYVSDILNNNKIINYVIGNFNEFMPSARDGKIYYVSQSANADDSNPGTEELPFLTISRAGEVAKAGDTVIVKAGVYRETVTVKNNGTGTAPIIFKAEEGENVIISALEEINGFINYKDNILVATIPWNLGDGRNQLFYKGKSIPEARYPNGPGINMGKNNEPLSNNWPVLGDLLSDPNDNLKVTSRTLLNQEIDDYWKGAYFVSMRGYCYSLNTARVESSKKGELRLTDHSTIYWDDTNHENWLYGFLVGHKNAMDIPGEWVIENNTLFVIPPEGENEDTLILEAKKRQLVADIAKNKFVQFKGFKTIGGSIRLNESKLCVIDSCEIRYNNHFILSKDQHSGFIDDANVQDKNGAPSRGEVGIYVGGRDNVFVNNIFDEAAGAAIYGVGLYTYIENNYIKNCGYAGSYVAGLNFNCEAWKGKTYPRGGNLIVGNTVYNTGRSPLHTTRPAYQSLWPYIPYEVAFNDFHNGMLASLDSGIVYTYMVDHGNDRIKSQMHNNLVYYTLPESNPYSYGIYHDGGTQNIDTYENIVFVTEHNVSITIKPLVYVQPAVTGFAECDVWNNSFPGIVPGGRDGLLPKHYPDGKPFDAGSSIGREPYTANYDRRSNSNETTIRIDSIEVSDGVSVIDGLISFSGDEQWVKFKNVDFSDGANIINLTCQGDKYSSNLEKLEVILDDIDNGRGFNFNNPIVSSPYLDQNNQASCQIPIVEGKHDVYIRVKNYKSIKITGFSISQYDLSEARKSAYRIYGGSFDDFIAGDKEWPPTSKLGARNDFLNPFVFNTQPGSILIYKKINIIKDSDYVTINYCTKDPYDNQSVQIRIGSATADPIAEFKTNNTGWSQWTDYDIKLKEVLPAGNYNIYITFDDPVIKSASCNIYYVEFKNSSDNVDEEKMSINEIAK